ncbi:uncharacterized protein IWZ02DRAFT_133621 [Phyllosticta citriasiana]|uniref:Uncharacterized protein n=1 Tax=Phyllosticta citriasiana TaxID=595635 RepID=A0ABR1KUH0_9PEZI
MSAQPAGQPASLPLHSCYFRLLQYMQMTCLNPSLPHPSEPIKHSSYVLFHPLPRAIPGSPRQMTSCSSDRQPPHILNLLAQPASQPARRLSVPPTTQSKTNGAIPHAPVRVPDPAGLNDLIRRSRKPSTLRTDQPALSSGEKGGKKKERKRKEKRKEKKKKRDETDVVQGESGGRGGVCDSRRGGRPRPGPIFVADITALDHLPAELTD